MSPPYGYSEAHPYWTMHPVQEVREPYCYTERYRQSPAYPWKYWQESYPEWEEYQYRPDVNYAPSRYRSSVYPYPPPPGAFTYAYRPFHPSDQFRHPDEYPMRFVPVGYDNDYESICSPRMRAIKQESRREMSNDKHCCGCSNHVCHSESNTSNPKPQIQSNRDAEGDKAKHQLREYPFPVVWFPYGHCQFPSQDFTNSNKLSEDEQKQIMNKTGQDSKLQPAPVFWMPPWLTLCKEDGNETPKLQNSDQDKKNPNESMSRSNSAEELGKEMPKPRDIPVKQTTEEKPSNEGISGASVEDLRKELPIVKAIPVMQAVEEKQAENRKETKSSSPRAPRLPPVCLRIDPSHKKADGKRSSRSPSPCHTGSAGSSCKECVKKRDKNTESNASQVGDEINTRKVEQPNNVQANKASGGGGCSNKKTHSMTTETAATIIQSFYRGYQVRRLQPVRKLREVSKIKGRMDELIKQMSNSELFVSLSRDVKAKERFSETLMGLLLQLDTIQGLHPVVRDMRKSIATEIVALQEKLDHLSIDCPQQISSVAEETELQDRAPEVSVLNSSSGHLQDERELVTYGDKSSAQKQKASSSSEIAGQESPQEAPGQDEIVLSSTFEQINQNANDALDIFSRTERDDSTKAEDENGETIQAMGGPLESVTAEKAAYSAELNVAEKGNDSLEVKDECEHENKHYDFSEVNVAERGNNSVTAEKGPYSADVNVVERGNDSLEVKVYDSAKVNVNNSVKIKVEGEQENKHYDSAEVKVEDEHKDRFQIQSLGGTLDSDTAEKESESAEAEVKIEMENANKHMVQAVELMNSEELNTFTNHEAETKLSLVEKASVDVPVSEEDTVEVSEIKNTPEKAEETELAARASISVEEKPIEFSASSAFEEENPGKCFPLTNNLEAGETFNPPLDIAFQSEKISAKSDELFSPATEFENKGEEFVPKCDEASNNFAQEKGFFDASNRNPHPHSHEAVSDHVIHKHAIEAETPEVLEHSVMELQTKSECPQKSDHNEEAQKVKCKEDWETENKMLKETVQNLLETAKCQASTIAKLDEKLRHLESKLSNVGRKRSRVGSTKLSNRNQVFLRRNTACYAP